MRRFAFTFLLTVLATSGISYAGQTVRKKPVKKSAAGQPVASKATRSSSGPAPKVPPRTVKPSTSVVDDAGNRAAAQAASERVHAWMRDHNEIITEPQEVEPKPVRRPATPSAAATSKPTTKPVTDNNGQTATTDDFLKAAEKRKAVEDKKQTEKKTAPVEEQQGVSTPPPAESRPAAEPQPVRAAAISGSTPVAPVTAAREPAKTLVLARPVAPAASTASNPVDREQARKPAIVEKAASELPAPPVLAVKRTELVEESPAPVSTAASGSIVQPKLTFRRGRLVVPAPLLGSHAILIRQNVVADKYGLERVQDDDDLERLRKSRQLVALPDNSAIQVDDRLPSNRRYARPWAVKFLNDLAKAHNVRFHGPLQINSAVRTVEFQQRLLRTNGNAAPAEGDTASPHLTGQAIDLAKHGLSMTEIAWLRAYLLPLVQEGKIDVEEEFQQACFHISIYKNYVPEPKKEAKPVRGRAARAALATALP